MEQQRHFLFDDVTLTSIETLLRQCPVFYLPAGRVLLSPGERRGEMYLILFGSISAYQRPDDEAPMTILQAGECVGELAVIDGGAYTRFAVAHEDSCVLALSKKMFQALLESNGLIARNTLAILARHLRDRLATMGAASQREQALVQRAYVDVVTGLRTRTWFDARLEALLAYMEKQRGTLSLVLLEVDGLRTYASLPDRRPNDDLFFELADALADELTPVDTLARHGEARFAAALWDRPLDGAAALAERWNERATVLLGQAAERSPLSASIGCAQARVHDSATSLMSAAGAALQRAKRRRSRKIGCQAQRTASET